MSRLLHRIEVVLRKAKAGLLPITVLGLLSVGTSAQNYNALYAFTGGADGALPYDTLTLDAAGNLYGTTSAGGSADSPDGNGTVFRLSRTQSGWRYSVLYTFQGGEADGAHPYGGVIFGPDGALYGTTYSGGGIGCGYGCGTVFRLTAPPATCASTRCSWKETIVYRFSGPDGNYPGWGDLLSDQSGAVYGTTTAGGPGGCGIAYKLTNVGGSWTETILHSFADGNGFDCAPYSGLTPDRSGNLYGTTLGGDIGRGSVYELSCSESGCAYQTLYDFPNGGQLVAGVGIDADGNLYGGTIAGGYQGGAELFQLASGSWTFSLLHALGCCQKLYGTPALDEAGNVYGALLFSDGSGQIFTIPALGNFQVLHTFSGNDGNYPYGGVAIDSNRNLYGTTYSGGLRGGGVIWELAH